MCGRDKNHEYLSLALQARLVIDTLVSYWPGETVHPNAKKGIALLDEFREALATFGLGEPRFSHRCPFRYEQLKLIDEVAKDMKWDTWKADLEQWLTNKERVLDFFTSLECRALNSIHHGCF